MFFAKIPDFTGNYARRDAKKSNVPNRVRSENEGWLRVFEMPVPIFGPFRVCGRFQPAPIPRRFSSRSNAE